MRSLADFEFNKVPLCDGMILISEMIRDDFTSQYVYAELENLVSPAREEINQARPQDWQLEKLIELFYGEWGFCDTRGVYRLSDALWLDGVEKSSGQRRRVGRHFTVGCARAGYSTGAGHFPDADDFAGGVAGR